MHKDILTIISLAVKDFDVGRLEVVRASKKGFGVTLSVAVTGGWLVGVAEVGVGARGGMCIVDDVQVVTTTKCWSVAGMIVYGILVVPVHSARKDSATVTTKQKGLVTTARTPHR